MIENEAVNNFRFAETLDRHLVNRRAVAEVFLTDFHPVTANEWIVGAQLPLGHAYMSDHSARMDFYDLLLILECCRQAGTYGGYTQFGSPLDTINIVSSLELHIADTEALRVSDRPGELVIHVCAVDVVRSGGRTKSATPKMTLTLNGTYVGTASIPVSLASPKLFQALRRRMRKGLPALTSNIVLPDAAPVSPRLVCRARPENVLIAGAVNDHQSARAELHLRPDNPNILDHDYDHIPAMALADASIQLMTWHTSAARATITRLIAAFERFTEVDAPVLLEGRVDRVGDYLVTFTQGGRDIGRVTLSTIGTEAVHPSPGA